MKGLAIMKISGAAAGALALLAILAVAEPAKAACYSYSSGGSIQQTCTQTQTQTQTTTTSGSYQNTQSAYNFVSTIDPKLFQSAPVSSAPFLSSYSFNFSSFFTR